MNKVDKRGKLDEDVFSYRETKSGGVMLYWRGKHIKSIAGKAAERFLTSIAGLEGKAAQLVMAKVTGNFKHGNERE